MVLRMHDDWPITAMSLVVSNLQWFTRCDFQNLYPFLGWPSSYELAFFLVFLYVKYL